MSTVDRAREYFHDNHIPTWPDMMAAFADQETADLRQQLEAAQRRVGELEAALRRAKSFVLKYITHAARKIPDPDSAMAALTDIETALASAKEPQP